MSYLIVYMHPSKDSFNGAVLQAAREELDKLNYPVEIKELANEKFSPHLSKEEYKESLSGEYPEDISKEHEKIKEAEHLIFIFPVWWGGFPALGKGYIDRVFSYGFAYELEGETPLPQLNGKKVSLIFTTGAPEKEFHESGMYGHMVELLDQSIFKFCGLELDGVLHFGDVIQSSDKDRQEMLKTVRQFISNLAEKT
ncbi:NAD(P)H-dependent oxidoreductase [Salipaludibacillus sp. CUR1]|uniref:NAD(P)H-dependent oxidoreductase n=1 Tax=Salipaludibacillus sp. CUR1 TaxID=2820003 RepID=UPI001E434D19|nr:NAD(P)H-dependent oxidoreductase [Salipaludibacillus sp. CUR1]MCE7793554.1 NAD(P)H-dependent oxidoreductase [Salipaludibacillus sp. CUR1]